MRPLHDAQNQALCHVLIRQMSTSRRFKMSTNGQCETGLLLLGHEHKQAVQNRPFPLPFPLGAPYTSPPVPQPFPRSLSLTLSFSANLMSQERQCPCLCVHSMHADM